MDVQKGGGREKRGQTTVKGKNGGIGRGKPGAKRTQSKEGCVIWRGKEKGV